jgi:hypothetical protein
MGIFMGVKNVEFNSPSLLYPLKALGEAASKSISHFPQTQFFGSQKYEKVRE